MAISLLEQREIEARVIAPLVRAFAAEVGEDAVADKLSPYIDAAPLEEQKYFLATQQVDEARHAVFFKRFMHEVCGVGEGSMASGLQAIKPQLTVGFRRIFDRLDTMADELRADRSRCKLATRGVPTAARVREPSLAWSGCEE